MIKLKIRNLFKKIKLVFRKINENYISEFSAQCAYYTILSFVPFCILLLSLIQYTGIDQQVIFDVLAKIVPDSMDDMVLGIVEELYSRSIGTISISVIFTIWSAGKGFYALTKGLHSIYNTNSEERTSYFYLRIKSLIGTVAFIILIALGLVSLVFGKSLLRLLQEHFYIFENFNTISSMLTQITFIITITIVFVLLYKILPKRKATFKSQIYGALFGAISLNIISYIFSKYIDIFGGRLSITYGSLATLMIIMIWVYTCFYVVFLGAELNEFIRKKRLS